MKQLADLLNLSFMTVVFRSVLKTLKVVPVFKNDTKLDYRSYRPISQLSNIGKIFEKLMYKRLPFSITVILSITYSLNSDKNILHHLSYS